jgi:hypothetical protein
VGLRERLWAERHEEVVVRNGKQTRKLEISRETVATLRLHTKLRTGDSMGQSMTCGARCGHSVQANGCAGGNDGNGGDVSGGGYMASGNLYENGCVRPK